MVDKLPLPGSLGVEMGKLLLGVGQAALQPLDLTFDGAGRSDHIGGVHLVPWVRYSGMGSGRHPYDREICWSL